MKQQNTVKFFYFRDPKEPQRVLTVARSLIKGKKHTKVQVGWAVSRPTQKDEFGYEFAKGDQFRKDRGRQIATGRLEKDMERAEAKEKTAERTSIKVKLVDGESPLRAAMNGLASNKDVWKDENGEEHAVVPRKVRQMAKAWMNGNPGGAKPNPFIQVCDRGRGFFCNSPIDGAETELDVAVNATVESHGAAVNATVESHGAAVNATVESHDG